jgi:hypothetical protein
MPIPTTDLDPSIRAALDERFKVMFSPQATQDPLSARVKAEGNRQWKTAARKHMAHFYGAGATFLGGLLTTAAMGSINEGAGVLGFLLAFGCSVALGIRGLVKTQAELTKDVNADVMRSASHLVQLTPSEKLYCDAVAALAGADAILPDSALHDLMRQLNDLLASARRLSGQIAQALASGGGDAAAQLEQTVAELAAKRDRQEDPTARRMMDQSIALCEQRLEAARAMAPLREQAEAQLELIHQTLASVQSTVACLQAAGAADMDSDIHSLQTAITQTNQQARSVEAAVQELRAFTG